MKQIYQYDLAFDGVIWEDASLNYNEFEQCRFVNCSFVDCNFVAVRFIDCVFEGCKFDRTGVNHTAFCTVDFVNCSLIGVNFAMISRTILEMSFRDCILDYSQFYALPIRKMSFQNCSMVAVDLMETDLGQGVLVNNQLHKAEFLRANVEKVDFRESKNYQIDPSKTKIKGAVFSFSEVAGLLYKHQLKIVD